MDKENKHMFLIFAVVAALLYVIVGTSTTMICGEDSCSIYSKRIISPGPKKLNTKFEESDIKGFDVREDEDRDKDGNVTSRHYHPIVILNNDERIVLYTISKRYRHEAEIKSFDELRNKTFGD